MPKKPPRDNPPGRQRRTVQSAASVLQRITRHSGVLQAPQGPSPAPPESLLERVRGQLPAELRPHLLDAMEKEGELVCFVDSAVWAGRFRLAAAETPALAAGSRLTLRVMPPGGYRR